MTSTTLRLSVLLPVLGLAFTIACGSSDTADPGPDAGGAVTRLSMPPIFALTTHEHHFGTLATIDQAQAAGDAGAELYRNTDWAHPPLKSFDPPLVFDGSSGLRVHCEWFNTSNDVVFPGLSASTNEMCFFWAYYYPSSGFQQCSEDGCSKS